MHYSNISLRQISVFMEVLGTLSLREEQHVRARYESFAQNYEDTVAFLRDIGLVRLNRNILIETPLCKKIITDGLLKKQTPAHFQDLIVEAVMSSKGIVRKDVEVFLANFHEIADRYEWRPDLSQRLRLSGIRNILIELGLVRYYPMEDIYQIGESQSSLIKNCVRSRVISPKVAAKMREANEALGLAAERAVMEFEGKRLSQHNSKNLIKWVSLVDVTLGYDIHSFSIIEANRGVFSDRFIEVKAVSGDDYRFFWTRNELESAKLLSDKYFLYLVPVSGKGKFDLEKLLIIQDPYQAVYLGKYSWNKNEELMSFSQSGV